MTVGVATLQQMLTPGAVAVALLLALVACGDDGDADVDTNGATAATGDDDRPASDAPEVPSADVSAGDEMTPERCDANEAAGTITFLTGFDHAATASAVEMMVAQERGYFDELCLDVDIRPSFSTNNYPLIAANEAQFASGGSFSEVVSFAAANDAEFVVTTVFGHVPIDVLIVKPGVADDLDALRGTTIGVKGKLPTGVEAMLAGAGLAEGTDFDTVLLDGFDPTAHMAIESIDGLPGWKSNEPGRLEREGIDFDLFDPADYDVVGSFGVVYTNRRFLDEHPGAAADVVLASLRGMADAVADPEAAAQIALDRINASGNPNFLSPEGEIFRWSTDADLITGTTSFDLGVGVPDLPALRAELEQAAGLGLVDAATVGEIDRYVDSGLAAQAYDDDATVRWPGDA